ncbi:MAG: flagellar filament capping protein FliD [Anaerovoracaceae bacterium]
MVAKEEGTGENIVISEQQGNLLTAFGLTTGAEKTEGKNAILTVNDQVIIRSSNSINIDGIKIDLLNTTEAGADPIKITMEADADSLLEPIKKFVEDYNSMMDLINGLTKEKVYSDYEPLTEEQKEEMTEEQIKKWEDKAKSGILRSDRILSSITSKLQSIIYGSAVEGGISLYNLGITSAGYNENGKLKIDETKLKEALASKSIEIRELFTSDEGIGNKMNDIILGAIKTSGVKGSRGTLVEVAGVLATTSDTENNISKSIERTNKVIETLQKKLTAEETRMWSRFTAMEKALQQLNAQSMMLSQFSPNSNY